MPKKYTNVMETRFTADDRFSRAVGRMSRGMQRMNRVSGRLKRGLKTLASATVKLGRVMITGLKAGAVAGVAAIGTLTAAIWKLSGSYSLIEDAQAAFTPLMGSASRAKDLVDALNKTAATTPFQFETLSDTAKQLLPSMNGNIERTIKLTRMLGDTAGGNAQKMESITRGYNKALLKGKVDMESLNMISEAGVPIFTELGKSMGVTSERLFKNITAGEVKITDLTGTFEKMTSKGGIFFKGMEVASKTLTGKISTLKDNATLAMAQFGEAMAPALKETADRATELAKSVSMWAMENKALIRQKFELYFNRVKKYAKIAFDFLRKNVPPLIKKLRQIGSDGFEWIKENKSELKSFFELIKWAGRVLLKTATFVIKHKYAVLGLVAAYKTLSLSMRLMEWSAMVSGADSASGALKNLKGVTLKYAKLIGKGGALAAAATAGWAVGSVIVDKWINGMDKIALSAENAASKLSMGLGKASESELDTRLATLKKQEKELGSKFSMKSVRAILSGDIGEVTSARAANREAQAKVLQEKFDRLVSGNNLVGQRNAMGYMAGRQSGGAGDTPALNPVDAMPQAQVSRSENVTVERVELTINDKTGSAEVSRTSTPTGLTLIRTGAM